MIQWTSCTPGLSLNFCASISVGLICHSRATSLRCPQLLFCSDCQWPRRNYPPEQSTCKFLPLVVALAAFARMCVEPLNCLPTFTLLPSSFSPHNSQRCLFKIQIWSCHYLPPPPRKPLWGHTALGLKTESFQHPRRPCRMWPPPTSPAPSAACSTQSLQSHRFSLSALHPLCSFPSQGLCTSFILCLEHAFQPSFHPFTYLTPAYPPSPSPNGTSSGKPSLMHPQTRVSEDTPPPLLTTDERTSVYVIILLFEDQGHSPLPMATQCLAARHSVKICWIFFFYHVLVHKTLTRIMCSCLTLPVTLQS